MKKLLALVLCLCLTLTPTLAIKSEVVAPNELPSLPPNSGDWAQSELAAAQEANLLVDSLGADLPSTSPGNSLPSWR